MGKAVLDIKTIQRWIKVRFSRSPKPGGQNVNKVNTRVTLLFDFERCDQLSDPQRLKIRKRFSTRLARDGRLRVVRHQQRTQAKNRQAAEVQLEELLHEVLIDEKVRKATRPTHGSVRRRLVSKSQRSLLKKQRHSATED